LCQNTQFNTFLGGVHRMGLWRATAPTSSWHAHSRCCLRL